MIDERTLPNGLVVGQAARAARRHRRHLREPAQRHRRHRLALPQGGQRRRPPRRQGGDQLEQRARPRRSASAIAAAGVPADAVQLIENTDRALVGELLKMKDVIDLVVPRGGAELIRFVAENATMPVLIGGIGVCHTYVDRDRRPREGRRHRRTTPRRAATASATRWTRCSCTPTSPTASCPDRPRAGPRPASRCTATRARCDILAGAGDRRPERASAASRTTSARSSWRSWPR